MKSLPLLVACSALVALAPTGAAPLASARVGRLDLRVTTEGRFLVAYAGLPVVRDASFYLANTNWTEIYPRGVRFTAQSSDSAGAREVRVVAGASPLATTTQAWQVTADSVTYTLEYAVTPGTDAHHAVCDIFLDRRLLTGAAYRGATGDSAAQAVTGTLAVERTGGVIAKHRTTTLSTTVGEITLTTSAENLAPAGPGSPWVLRNLCDRPWGDVDLRTWSMINHVSGLPAGGLRQRLTFTLSVQPAADLDARVAAEGLARGLRVLAGDAAADAVLAGLPAAPQARAAALQRELDRAGEQWQGRQTKDRTHPPYVVPEPQEMRLGDGTLAVPDGVVLSVAPDLTPAETTGITTLVEELEARCGVTAVVRPGAPAAPGTILIGEPGRNPAAAARLAKLGVTVSATEPGPEGYVLRVSPEGALVAGSDAAGTFYGLQSLIQLLRRDATGRVTIPECAIRDWPALKWRGLNIEGFGGNVPLLRSVIHRIAARYKLNTLVVGGSYRGYRWRSHPELAGANALEVAELGRLAEYARDHHLEFIPHFQSLGHLNDLLAVHPELAEHAELASQKRAGDYCPSNPDTYRVLFDVWQEVLDATRPRWFHAGHDEVQHLGFCERCREKTHGELLATDITRLHDWLKERGVGMIIWGDMLLNAQEWRKKGPYAANGDTTADRPHGTDTAIDRIPKDVVIADWHYHPMPDYESQAYFAGKGLRVLACPWYDDGNNHAIAVSAERHQALGVLVTDWGFLATLSAAGTSVVGMAGAWSPGRPALDQLPYTPVEELADQLRPRRPSDALGARFTPLALGVQATRRLSSSDWSDTNAWFGDGPGWDLWQLRPGRQTLRGMAFDIARDATGQATGVLLAAAGTPDLPPATAPIAVDARADSLLLLTGLQVAEPGVWISPVARLTATYQDGTSATYDLCENRDVTDWRTYLMRRNPWHWREGYADLYGAKPAFRGVTRFGEAVNLPAFEWENPQPERPLATIQVQVTRNDPTLRLALVALTAVTRP